MTPPTNLIINQETPPASLNADIPKFDEQDLTLLKDKIQRIVALNGNANAQKILEELETALLKVYDQD